MQQPTACAMRIASSFGNHLSTFPPRLSALALVAGFATIIASGCTSGYTPGKTPEPDIDALLAAPQYAAVQIIHKPDAGRSITATAAAGTIIMEYLVDDKLVGSHSVHSSFDEVIHMVGGDHELVVQQCYRGLMTLGGRSCQYIKYHFRVRPGELGQVNLVHPNVLRPKLAGFVQWYELEVSRY